MSKLFRFMAWAGLMTAVLFGMLLLIFTVAYAAPEGSDPKVWVCKYVGKPGVDERLKEGKNPIVVSSNATIGTWFNDAQGRSYVLDIQTEGNTGPGNKYIGELQCPGSDNPPCENGDCPPPPPPPCVKQRVFYWFDGWCSIRQRGGPIMGQSAPFTGMQNMYCGCGYAHADGWKGIYAETDCNGQGASYQYWNELPQFCGAQSCE